MAKSNEYPRLLYRRGSQEEVWGVMCDLLRVESAEEQADAEADGWGASPPSDAEAEIEPAPKGLLDENAKRIAERLPELSDEELLKLLEDEQGGKTRKGVIKAIEAAIDARKGTT